MQDALATRVVHHLPAAGGPIVSHVVARTESPLQREALSLGFRV